MKMVIAIAIRKKVVTLTGHISVNMDGTNITDTWLKFVCSVQQGAFVFPCKTNHIPCKENTWREKNCIFFQCVIVVKMIKCFIFVTFVSKYRHLHKTFINYFHGDSSCACSQHVWSCNKNIISVVLYLVLSQAMTRP